MALKHYLEKGYIYYITSVTHLRKKIFLDEIAARFLLITIAYHKFVLDFKLLAYVIMPEHFHMIIQPSDERSLSKIMNFIKGNFSRKYNQIYGRTDPVWQKRYYDEVMKSEKDIINKINYIHKNPVSKKLVADVSDYEFSSYNQYFGEIREKIQIPIDKILLVVEHP